MIPHMGKKTIDIFADNLNRNCGPGKKFNSITDLSDKSGLGTSTIDRLRKSQASLRLDTLESVARAYGLDAWQVLVPELDLKNPPKLAGDGLSEKEKKMIAAFQELTEPEKAGLLATARAMIEARAGAPDSKSTDAA